MKEYFKKILSFLVGAVLLCSGVCASGGNGLEVEWRGDYENMELIVWVKTAVNYTQQVTVVMYSADTPSPGYGDYCRTAEISVNPRETGEIRFKISDSLDADGRAYKILAQGNGHQSGISRAEVPVWLMRPSDIADSSGNGLLKDINGSTAATVKQNIEKVKAALQLTVAADESSTRLNSFLNIQKTDFNQSFGTMEDVRLAWETSDIIEYLSKGGADTAVLEAKFNKCADALGLNTTDADYTENREDIYKTVVTVNRAFNNKSGAKNCSDIKKVFKQAKGLAVINNSLIDDMEANIAEYYQDLGIAAEVYQKFVGFSDSNMQKVSRQLLQKGFTRTEDAVKAFTDSVNEISGSLGGDTGGGAGGGGVGGGGVGGGVSAGIGDYSVTNNAPNTVQPQTDFADCGMSHWAYTYVNRLKDSGIISGYSDGRFYPDRAVNREEFVKMAILASGLYSENYTCEFDDVLQNEWYFKFIAAAHHLEIINGVGDSIFGVGQSISREDVAVIVHRILSMLNAAQDSGEKTDAEAPSFSDSMKVSDYAADSVALLSDMSVLNGFEDGSFRPQNSLTRAEAAKIICKLRERIQK